MIARNVSRSDDRAPGTRPANKLTLRVWHPDCWTLETTAVTDAALIVHGVYMHEGVVTAHLTAYADTQGAIEDLVAEIETSRLTNGVARIYDRFDPSGRSEAAGNATEELLVHYEPHNSIHDAFVSRGFVPEEQIRIQDGYEYWNVIVSKDRATIQSQLEEIREEKDAEVTVEGMRSPDTRSSDPTDTGGLSERQREVFELARTEGYYSWPRETSASDLADQLGVSKTTLLEHLRKAEAKLLGSD